MSQAASLRENTVHQMKGDQCLREYLLYALKGDGAHLDFDTAIKNNSSALRGKKPNGAAHTPWQLLEHLRIAQADIFGYLRSPDHISPEFPAGYWPATEAPPSEKAWDKSADDFRNDQKALIEFITEKSSDLLAPLPGTEDQNIFRKVLMLADHNAYHLGQLVVVRRALGDWTE